MIGRRAHRQGKAWEEFVMTLVYPVSSLSAHSPRLSPAYKSTVNRSPTRPLIPMRHTLSELTGPVYGHETVRENDHDLTLQG
jgi:protocatechuate 3,4-dioxygenase beta subunit